MKSSPHGNYVPMENMALTCKNLNLSAKVQMVMDYDEHVCSGRAKEVCRGVCYSVPVIEKFKEWCC